MATGIRDVSLLSLSTSDYPKFETLVEALREKLRPLDATLSVPSLRVNHQLAATMRTLTTERTSGLTIAPEAALDSMRKRIGKPISTENLLAGCRSAYETGFNRVKMYFMIGLPEETIEDVDGILRLSYDVAFLGKEVRGRMPTITTNVSNFVPKPHTPFERHGMRHGEYFRDTHRHLRQSCRVRSVSIKYHDTETSLLEGLLCRGDRRLDAVIESAWRAGSRLEAWGEHFRPELWKRAVEEHRIPVESIVHEDYPDDAELPWSVIRL